MIARPNNVPTYLAYIRPDNSRLNSTYFKTSAQSKSEKPFCYVYGLPTYNIRLCNIRLYIRDSDAPI